MRVYFVIYYSFVEDWKVVRDFACLEHLIATALCFLLVVITTIAKRFVLRNTELRAPFVLYNMNYYICWGASEQT